MTDEWHDHYESEFPLELNSRTQEACICLALLLTRMSAVFQHSMTSNNFSHLAITDLFLQLGFQLKSFLPHIDEAFAGHSFQKKTAFDKV